ncbi:MAG TPA: DUF6067 family protein, partial [bacterium]|nr:DUF6067 family protein [bacterium]
MNKPQRRPRFIIPYFKTPPVLDGIIHEEEWPGIKIKGLISQRRSNKLEFRDVEAWLGWDEQNLYIAVKSVYHPEAGLINIAQPMPDETDASFKGGDDTLEFFFAPDASLEENNLRTDRVYQIIMNANQAIYDIMTDTRQGTFQTSWRVKQRSAHTVKDGYWQTEIAFALSSFEIKNLENWWGFRICRNFKNPWDQSRLGINVIAFASPETMPLMKLSRKAPVIKHHTVYDQQSKRVNLHLTLENTTPQAIPVRAVLAHNALNQPRYDRKAEFLFQPGQKEEMVNQVPISDPQGYTGVSVVEVTSPDGQIIYYQRDFLWDAVAEEKIWTPVPRADIKAVRLNLAYYPSLNKLAVLASFQDLAGKEAVREARIEVVPAGKNKVLARKKVTTFTNFTVETVLTLPSGMKGEYEVRLYLSGGSGVPGQPVVERFERDRFVWEGNRIGITEVVIPPFKPIVVAPGQKTATVVLRKYTFSPLGLWQQVEADGQDLLSEPMDLELIQQGKVQPVSGKGVRFTRVKPGLVCGQADFSAGELFGKTLFQLEYDGLMKVTVNLNQKGKTLIDRLSLVIPLKARRARLMHVCGDGLRFNYGGVVPAGQGIVWESKNASRNLLLGTFIPYVWFGEERRGLCWFAENDRGWILDDRKSALTMERSGETVALKVHLINKPATLTQPVQIVFGVMASPAKPMPENPPWQKTTFNGPSEYPVRVHGSSFYWNGQMYANFPHNRDFETIRRVAQANKEGKSDKEYCQRLINAWSEETHDISFESHRAHINSGLSPGNYKGVIPYTNVRGDLTWIPEWRTYQDEWSYLMFRQRTTDRMRKKGSIDFSIIPVPSRQDFLLYYYQKFFENGFDGIYWDNIYLQSSYNLFFGPVYQRVDGQKQPYVDIFHCRELVKRTMVLSHQQGKPNLSMVHMTNANLLPIFSFAGSLLGWEWKYGLTDFQDRFSPEYIRAVNLPFNSGCIPVQLSGIHGEGTQEVKDWCARTRAAVTLVHELHVWNPDKLLTSIWEMLWKMGYGTGRVKTYRYWEEPALLLPNKNDLLWIVHSEREKAVAIFCDYGQGGPAVVRIDTGCLGFKPALALD